MKPTPEQVATLELAEEARHIIATEGITYTTTPRPITPTESAALLAEAKRRLAEDLARLQGEAPPEGT